MSAAVMNIAQAIADQATVSTLVQTTTAVTLLQLLNCYMPLTEDWNEQLTADEQQYFLDTLQITQDNPQQAAVAGADYQKIRSRRRSDGSRISRSKYDDPNG